MNLIDAAGYQKLYLQLGRLLETAPDMSTYASLRSPETFQWVGRAHALVATVKIGADPDIFSLVTNTQLYTSEWKTALAQLYSILYRALAHCELHSPAASAGSFVPVGNAFDAFAAISKLLQSATRDVMIVDPYLDETALTEFGLAAPTAILLRLLADESDPQGVADSSSDQMGGAVRSESSVVRSLGAAENPSRPGNLCRQLERLDADSVVEGLRQALARRDREGRRNSESEDQRL